MTDERETGNEEHNLRPKSVDGQRKSSSRFQGQLISQIEGPVVVIEQVFAVLSCVAMAFQLGGGPGSAVAVIATPTVGTKPCADPFPLK